jgi:hypothetical protein
MNNSLKVQQEVGGYRLGNHNLATTFCLTYKPKWIHRKMMKIFFGLDWIDFKQQEQCNCGQPKVGGYSCQRTDCNQNL